MPTDPFVATDLDDRPRQQQNLPPGAAYPPARSRSGRRPGELGPGRPAGALLGSPGPDVGFGYTLARRSKERLCLGAHEHLADAIAVVAEIGMKRATFFGRAPAIADIDVAVALLGYDGDADPEFVAQRSSFVSGADHEYPVRRAIVDTVSEETLRLRPSEIAPRIARWRAAACAQLTDTSLAPAQVPE